MTTVPVFLTIDDKFPFYLDCAIRSIMKNASKDYDYRIFVLHEDLPEPMMEPITGLNDPTFHIEFVRLGKDFAGITDRPENRLRCDFFTPSIFYRIFIADLFPQYDKGIYIDSDVIVPGDISELFKTDLCGNIIGACPDFSVRNLTSFVRYFEQSVGIPIESYINSGVLLMDLKMMRDLHFSEHFLDLMNTYHFNSIAPDQDYINAMCYGKVLFLDESWDAMPPVGGGRPLLENPNLIHYNIFFKPWLYDDIPYEKYFWDIAKESPFYNDILEFKAGYTDENKDNDQKTLELMKTNAEAFIDKDVTFRKMYESGASIRI